MNNNAKGLVLILIPFFCGSCHEKSQARLEKPQVRSEKIIVSNISESDSVYVKSMWQGGDSRVPELHLCVTDSTFSAYSDSISLSVFESSNSINNKQKDMLFNLLITAVKQEESKRIRNPIEGDYSLDYELKYYKDGCLILDTCLFYGADYQYFSDETLLLMRFLLRETKSSNRKRK